MRQTIAPKDLAAAIGVSESSVKRWADEGRIDVSRTVGGHRRIAVADAIRFIRETGACVTRPELLGLSELEHLPSDLRTNQNPEETLYQALEKGDGPVVRGILQSLFVNGTSVAAICDGPFAGAMRRIGTMWMHAEWGIFIEHRATDIAIQAMNQLRTLIGSPQPTSPVVLGGAPEGDLYVLPSLMVAATLASIGFKDINLGARTPVSVLQSGARQYDARLVWMSFSVSPVRKTIGQEVIDLAQSLRRSGTAFVVGGRCTGEYFAETGPVGPMAHVLSSLTELTEYARPLLTQPLKS